jgi:nucleoside-diphosphate-sugar epimerase
MANVTVTGASGFIGHHLCRYLRDRGHFVRGVDWKRPIHFDDRVADEEWWDCDLRNDDDAITAMVGCTEVYALAADMGGMGFISRNHSDILYNNALINLNTAAAARKNGVERLLFTSSACVYPEILQLSNKALSLEESDAWNGAPDTAYGVEKLFAEEVYARLAEETGIEVRIARFHNIYGPEGSWNDGREKLPAAACRKVSQAKLSGSRVVEVWGDGQATRSFCYITDCLEMLYRLMYSTYGGPVNIGTDKAVAVDDIFKMVGLVADADVELVHVPGPQGVRGRNADLALMRKVLQYEPLVPLVGGIALTYGWIEERVRDDYRRGSSER